jgi:hypothetical protein
LPEITKALYILGTFSIGNSTSTIAPITWTTTPTFTFEYI